MPVASGGVAALLPLLYGQSQLGRYGSAAILIPGGLILDRPGRVCQPTRPERQPQAEGDAASA